MNYPLPNVGLASYNKGMNKRYMSKGETVKVRTGGFHGEPKLAFFEVVHVDPEHGEDSFWAVPVGTSGAKTSDWRFFYNSSVVR